jgi:hypothetical protein
MGFVYVFNASPQQVRLSINNPPQPSTPMSGTTPNSQFPYTPFGMQVVRSENSATPGAFINGRANSVVVQTRGLSADPVSLDVPAASESTADLWLYVFSDIMILFDTAGKQVDLKYVYWPANKNITSETPRRKKPITGGRQKVKSGGAGRRRQAAKGGRR